MSNLPDRLPVVWNRFEIAALSPMPEPGIPKRPTHPHPDPTVKYEKDG